MTQKTFGHRNEPGLTGHEPDLQRVGAGRVGDPHRPAGIAEHLREPAAGLRVDEQRGCRAVPVRQPVHRAPHLDHAGLTGPVAVQAAQMVLGRDELRRPRGGRGTEPQLEPARRGGVGAVEDPDVPGHVVDDALTVGGRVPGVHAVVIGVAADVGAVQRARIDVAGALEVRKEEQPAADQHRAAELAVQVGQHPREEGVGGAGGPQPAPGTAAVALPVCEFGVQPAGEQGAVRVGQRQIGDRAERQPPRRRALHRDRVRPHEIRFRFAGGADGENLAVRRPAGHPGPVVAPVGEPARGAAVGIGHVDFGASVPPAGPGDRGPVRGESRVAHLSTVSG